VINNLNGTASGTFLYTYPGSKKPLFLSVVINTSGGADCEGSVAVRWIDSNSSILRGWTRISGSNVGNGNSGGSAMTNAEMVNVPFIEGSTQLQFRANGCHPYTMNVIAVIDM